MDYSPPIGIPRTIYGYLGLRERQIIIFTGLLEFYQGSCHLCSGGGSQQLPGRLRLRKTEIPRFQCTVLLYLSQMMIPSQLTLIPRFVIFSAVGLVNTHWALILPKVVAVSATFMMRQAFLGTSEELREAAKIDGASEFRIFYQIMVPIIIPTIAAVCTTQFVSSWNSYLDPLIFINKSALYTLPLVLDNFVSMEATQYGLMMAACCLATVPVFIVFLCGQKFFIKGLTVGAVKG